MTKTTSLNYSEKKYPLTPGYKEQSTSKEAAGKINTRAAKLRTEILQILERKNNYGGTCEEIAEIMSEDITSIRPRFTELKHMNYIVDSGNRRINKFNNNTKVWRYNDRRNK